jgi:hypothetical protein
MTETDLSTWLPIADAAVIGCSTRTIERLGRAKKLEQRLKPVHGSPPVAVYNPDDVARLASERHQAPAPFVLGAVPTGNGNGHRPSTNPGRRDGRRSAAGSDRRAPETRLGACPTCGAWMSLQANGTLKPHVNWSQRTQEAS